MNPNWFPGHWRVYSEYNVAIDNFDLYLAYKNHQDEISVLIPAQFSSHKHGSVPVRTPWLSGSLEISQKMFLQDMLDAAWEIGLRPTGAADQKGTLDATQAHLRDMRAIVAGKLKIELS